MLICVKGKGYTYTWPEALGTQPWKDGKADKVMRQDYEPVGMVSAAPMAGDWFHQHFGISKDPLRLTAWFGINNSARAQGRACPARRSWTMARSTSTRAAAPSRIIMEDPAIRAGIRGDGSRRKASQSRMNPEFYERPPKEGEEVPGDSDCV